MKEKYITTDDWKIANPKRKRFFDELKIHLSVVVDDKDNEEILERLIAISLRNKLGNVGE